jgi:hypothetical protein
LYRSRPEQRHKTLVLIANNVPIVLKKMEE